MEVHESCEEVCTPLLLPSLRLFIPPLRLVSAALWQVVQRGDILDYGMLEEFVATVTDIVPELLRCDQRAQLLLGLRARLLLELCRTAQIADLSSIQRHLAKVRTLISAWEAESQTYNPELEFPQSNFVDLVETLLKDPTERENFFQNGELVRQVLQATSRTILQDPPHQFTIRNSQGMKSAAGVFPVDFGPAFDSALQMLMFEFLSKLEKFVPVPDLQETASMLSAVPSVLEECVQAVPDPQQLKTLLEFHKQTGHLDFIESTDPLPSSFGDNIFSSLSLPPLVKVVIDTEQVEFDAHTESMHDCISVEVEGESVTLLGYSGIDQQLGEGQEDTVTDIKEHSMDTQPEDGDLDHQDDTELVKPSPFLPLKQSRRLQLKRKALQGRKQMKDAAKRVSPKRARRKFLSNSKTCPVCGKIFPRATAMRRHQEIHSEDRQLRYKCPKCEKCFRDQYDMKRHQMRVHERDDQTNKEDPSLSSGGEKESPQPSTSKVRTILPKASPRKEALDSKTCSVCGRYFARASDMARHMRSHSQDRPHQCPRCAKRFKYSYDLKKHQRELCKAINNSEAATGETQETLFSSSLPGMLDIKTCPVCSKVLPCTADMAKHLRAHTDERPYRCITCDKGFKYRDTLKKHQEIVGHEGVQEDPCQSFEELLAELTQRKNNENLAKENETGPQTAPATPEQGVKKNAASKTCKVCGRTFTRAKDVARHMLSHSEERPYQCFSCKKEFKYLHSLKRHQIYICRKQNAHMASLRAGQQDRSETLLGGRGQYLQDSSRMYHQEGSQQNELLAMEQNSQTAEGSINPLLSSRSMGVQENNIAASSIDSRLSALTIPCWCSNCGKSFDQISALKDHQDTVCKVQEKEVYKCDDCGKDLRSASFLKIHRRTHNPFYCTECGRILADAAALERHKFMHKRIQCTMCDKTFTVLKHLREHYLHQHKFTGPFPCSQCDKTFTQLSYLVVHERVHTGDFPFQCTVCPEKFRASNCLTVHMRKHTGEKPFLCWQCGKSYTSASQLSVHVGTHSDEKPFACSQCDMAYRTKLQLTSHIEQIHIGVRFPCEHCGKQFMKEVSLKRHELIHTGERPYPCTDCTKTFLTANELRLHTRYHTGERPYKCEFCGKAFIQSGYLKSHKRIHTGEKPFKCDICDKGFRLSCHMKKHRQTHSGGEKHFECGVCGLYFTHRKYLKEHEFTHEPKQG